MALSFSAMHSLPSTTSRNNSIKNLDNVRSFVNRFGIASVQSSSLQSLQNGHWVKLICGASFELDERPMSGDIGRDATRETIAFAAQLALSNDRPLGCHTGFLQLAGGTNFHTVDGLKKERLFQSTSTIKNSTNEELSSSLHALIGGIAYGGYARKIVGRALSSMQTQNGDANIEDYPYYLLAALVEALTLVGNQLAEATTTKHT